MNIKYRGTSYTNQSSRRGKVPQIIVNHITAGTAESANYWFNDSNNLESSAHFIITKKGEIWQYVDISKNAWANGLMKTQMDKTTSPFLIEYWEQNNFINPNWISVSIEHEALKGESLTEKQYEATLWLHDFIIEEIKRMYDHDFIIDREHIIGHKEINKIDKPFCPMEDFPYERLIKDLKKMRGIKNTMYNNMGETAMKNLKSKGIILDDDILKNINMDDQVTFGFLFMMFDKFLNIGNHLVDNQEELKRIVIVTANILNVRDDIKGKWINEVKLGDELQVLDEKDGWFQIVKDEIKGWVSGDYVYEKTENHTLYKTIRKFGSMVHIFEANQNDYTVDVTLGEFGKLEKLSDIQPSKEYEKYFDKKIVCAINGGFFDTRGTTEHLGTYVDEGKYYKSPMTNFIDFIYYSDGTTEIKKIKDLKEVAELQPLTNWVIGTSWSLIQNGNINLENANKIGHSKFKHPRTLLGQREDGTWIFVVVEGRGKNKSVGITAEESAIIMKELDCFNAVNLDGGGSSEMIVDGKIVNEPSDGVERFVGSAIVVYEK